MRKIMDGVVLRIRLVQAWALALWSSSAVRSRMPIATMFAAAVVVTLVFVTGLVLGHGEGAHISTAERTKHARLIAQHEALVARVATLDGALRRSAALLIERDTMIAALHAQIATLQPKPATQAPKRPGPQKKPVNASAWWW